MGVFQKAERRKAKLKLALCGPSGSGKTFSALLIAKGMGGRIALIDTENDSGQLYSDLTDYDVAPIAPPFSVDKFIGAIKAAEQEGYNVLIIDSLSHAWAKEGGILDEVDKRSGKNAFTSGWREATPLHNKLIDCILQSPLHIIVTMRAKTAYEVEKDEHGKSVVTKKGMEPVQRQGLEYEFTVVLDMDNTRHTATSGKDRTRLFDGQCFVPDEGTGARLIQWLNTGVEAQPQYYQPQSAYQQPAFQTGGYAAQPNYQQPYTEPQTTYQQPAQPVQPEQGPFSQPAQPQPLGFVSNENEIVYYMANSGFTDIAGYVRQRFQREPNQLTTEECYGLATEFYKYFCDKQGGQQ